MLVPTSFLEMRQRPSRPPLALPDATVRIERARWSPSAYRALYGAVGEAVGWRSRQALSDAALETLLGAALFELHVLFRGDLPQGFFEIDRRLANEAELVHFGLVPAAQGKGLAAWMLDTAIRVAWAEPMARFWLHTDVCDSPRALGLYKRAGFVVYDETEVFYPG